MLFSKARILTKLNNQPNDNRTRINNCNKAILVIFLLYLNLTL